MVNIDKSLKRMLGNKKIGKVNFGNNIMKDFGLKSFGGKKDWDFDGVPNWKDCQPKNTMRQHWTGKTDVPIADYPKSYGFTKTIKQMKPQEFLELTRQEVGRRVSGASEEEKKAYEYIFDPKTYEEVVIYKPTVQKLIPPLRSKKPLMEEPWVETRKGIPVSHEGRHRAVAAREIGIKTIPVHFVETEQGWKDNDIHQDNESKNAQIYLSRKKGSVYNIYNTKLKKHINRDVFKKYRIKIVGSHSLDDYGGMNYYASKHLKLGFVPNKNEILVEKDNQKMMASTILHEITEAELMKKGAPYKAAHKKSIVVEINAGIVPRKIIIESNKDLFKKKEYGKVYEDNDIQQDNESKDFGWHKKKDKYIPIESREYQTKAKVASEEYLQPYGEVTTVPGKTVGRGVTLAGIVVPGVVPLPLAAAAGQVISSKVESVKLIKTDIYDNPYVIPRIQIHFKGKDEGWEDNDIREDKQSKDFNQDDMLRKITRKGSDITVRQGVSPIILMNTIIANDPIIKGLEKAQVIHRDDDWHARWNVEARRALKEQGYSDDDVDDYLSRRSRAMENMASNVMRRMGL